MRLIADASMAPACGRTSRPFKRDLANTEVVDSSLDSLDLLDEMAGKWAKEVGVADLSLKISGSSASIAGMLHQAFVEGAYRASVELLKSIRPGVRPNARISSLGRQRRQLASKSDVR